MPFASQGKEAVAINCYGRDGQRGAVKRSVQVAEDSSDVVREKDQLRDVHIDPSATVRGGRVRRYIAAVKGQTQDVQGNIDGLIQVFNENEAENRRFLKQFNENLEHTQQRLEGMEVSRRPALFDREYTYEEYVKMYFEPHSRDID